MDNGWIRDEGATTSAETIVNALNQAFTAADLSGVVYRHPTEGTGALLIMVGEGPIDPATALYILGANGPLQRLGLSTTCATPTADSDNRQTCVTEATPAVISYLLPPGGPEGEKQLTLKELASLTAALQADL